MPHPALQSSKGISSDVFPGAFDWFFTYGVFRRWFEARRTWQLHCIGGPGAGKSILSSLVYRHLKAHPETQHYPIVSIYVDQDVPDHENYFVEDFLELLYIKLAETTAPRNDVSYGIYQDYSQKRRSSPSAPEGSRIRERLRLLREALYSRLGALQKARAFLLLDGIDRCSQTLRLMLEEELAKLSDVGLSILLTSRLAVFEQGEVRCDHRNHGNQPDDDPLPLASREALDMFLECSHCGADLCLTCRDANRICPKG
ncbi:uncharacterized protein K460DRAFT_208877 [Cucurbitaria berberidis CBS 394.84]|uniref:Nephrocystin 3-like N-terminal domain-containing protein n=1 Tax=Cucurbitaria berberidis CBS 394.84 TaxID=1168544 RepID=A0A9P4G7H3_9PLEO|nr:uncharacterized protein K460DRAFT_208877 [Cucurbitaria berberidis CBS 394.84]KAF1840463.1 hypothetical protein K460DRAFT_208877 [Cucurbitaria berberidis CBS 394.84]